MDCVREQRQPRDPLHRQHQEGVHRQRLARGAALQLLQSLDELWILQLEPLEGAVLVHLVGAVLDVDLEVFFGVRAEDVGDPRQTDRLLPSRLEVGEESLRTGSDQNHLREQDALVPLTQY